MKTFRLFPKERARVLLIALVLGIATGGFGVSGPSQGLAHPEGASSVNILIPPLPIEVDIWVDRGEGGIYYVGEPLEMCYDVSEPIYVRIWDCQPGLSCRVILQGNDDGTGDCRRYTVNPPPGREVLRIEAIEDDEIVAQAQTWFWVQEVEQEPGGEISGIVFEDTDRDGRIDFGERGLGRVRVALRESPHGRNITMEDTSLEGRYQFRDVAPGSYYVVETDPPGYISTTSNTVQVQVESGEQIEVNFGDVPDPPTLTPTPTSTPTSTPTPTPSQTSTPTHTSTSTPTPTQTPTPTPTPPIYFVEDHIIVTGPRDELEQVIQAVSGTVTLTLVDRFELTYLDTFPLNPPARFHLAERVLLVMDLYRITDRTPVVQAVALINQQAVALGFEVFADPNYLTGRPPILTTGDPWTIEGSPAGGSAQAAQELFRTQWTFRENGIRLFAREERAIAYTGQRVRVGVFDTSPFDEPGEKRFEEVTLRVSHPKPAVDLRPPPEAQDVRDHGVYVAGLVHAVAPNSDIHLIRVLNEYGQGDLYTLNKALDTFIKETLADRGLLTGSTINLSLGVHQPPDPGALGLPADVVALETIVFGAERLGLVVVAAAGNDSNATTVQPMQLPAAYPVVIGVSASNIGRGRACFSNRGDVAAPGGDGGLPDCAPMVYQCFSQPAYCSISLAWTSDTNYVYWTGTSFAAPLVTGLATLMLEKGGTRMTPARVAAAIYRAALPADEALGAGIVDLQRTLLPSTYYLPLVINGWLP